VVVRPGREGESFRFGRCIYTVQHPCTLVKQECSTYALSMPVNADTTVRKMLSIPRELWQAIEDYRFERRIKTESEALRKLIEAGLRAEKQPT
jgi:hypothetical protein